LVKRVVCLVRLAVSASVTYIVITSSNPNDIAGFKAKFGMSTIAMLLPHFRRLGSEFIWIAIGQSIAVLGGIVGIRILTSMLSPERYGELALGMTLATLQQQLIMGPICGACGRYFAPARENGQLVAYLRAVKQLLMGATVLIIGVATLISLGLWAFNYEKWLRLVLLACLLGLLSGYGLSLDNIQNAARQRVVVAWHQSLMQWLRFLCALATVTWLGSSGRAALQGYILASVVVLASQLVFFKRTILAGKALWTERRPDNSPDLVRNALSYAWPFATWGVFTWMQLSSDRWALQAFDNTRSVGLYAVLYQLGYYPMALFSDMLIQLSAPILFGIAGYGDNHGRLQRAHRLIWALFLGLIVMTLIAVLISSLFHRQIFRLLVDQTYHNVSSLLAIMVLSGGLLASGQVIALIFMMSYRTKHLLVPKVGTALLGVILNVSGAYWFSLRGVIVANVIFSFIYVVWMLYLANILKKIQYLYKMWRPASHCLSVGKRA